LLLDDEVHSMSFNSDSIEEAIDLAYDFTKEQKKATDKSETKKQIIEHEIIIEMPQTPKLKIDEDILNGEFKTTTSIRLYSDILAQFKDFADTYKEYKSIDLVSMALLEYIEKYKD
jgi:uncharacterized protein (DUF4415 family)